MDLQTIINVFFNLLTLLCAALVVYGGWLCWSASVWGDETDRHFGTQIDPLRQTEPEGWRDLSGNHEATVR